MPESKNRYIRILGVAWVGWGVLFFALAIVVWISVVLGDDPESVAFESGDKWWIVVLVFLVIGAVGMVNGFALLLRSSAARPFLAISSLVLLLPSASSLVPLLVVVPSLWLTFSRDGKKALESYMARESG